MRRRRIIFRFSCVVLFRMLCEEEGGSDAIRMEISVAVEFAWGMCDV